MNYLSSINTPLQSILWPKENSLIKQSLLLLIGVMALALSAQLSIPLQPVPLTFQSATVILLGMIYGARLGTYTVLAYLIAGLAGLPVFADFTFGIAPFLGPRCGYLIGFLPAALSGGYLAQKGWAKNIFTSFVAACLSASLIFLLGATVLAQFIGWQNAMALGVMPFMLSEFIKLLAVAGMVPTFWKKGSLQQ